MCWGPVERRQLWNGSILSYLERTISPYALTEDPKKFSGVFNPERSSLRRRLNRYLLSSQWWHGHRCVRYLSGKQSGKDSDLYKHVSGHNCSRSSYVLWAVIVESRYFIENHSGVKHLQKFSISVYPLVSQKGWSFTFDTITELGFLVKKDFV